MIWMIAKRELLEQFYSLKFRIVSLLCIGVIITSNLILLADYQRRMDDYALNVPKEGEARAIIKPSILRLYCVGLSDNMGRGFDIQPGTLMMIPGGSLYNPGFISFRFPVPDVCYLVRILLSLLAMLIAFDSICGEKVRGTLRLLLSNGVSRTRVVAGKICGNIIALMIPFTFAFLLGLLLISVIGKFPITSEEFIRIGFFYAGSVVYLLIFLFLATTVSARTAMPGSSLVTCLFLWAILVFGIPNLSGTIARAISPLPSAQALEEEKLLVYNLTPRRPKEESENRSIAERLRHEENEYRNALNRYVDITQQVSRLSPASSFVFFSSSLTKSGFEDERFLKQHVIQYRDAIFQNPAKAGEVNFAYTTLGLAESLHNVTVDALVMFLLLIILAALSTLSFISYDVR